MGSLTDTVVITQICATISLLYYLYFIGRILYHFSRFKNAFYICVLSMSVSGIVHLLFSAADFWNYVQYTNPAGFWATCFLDNFTGYAETFNMVHVALCRFVASFFPQAFEKMSCMTTTMILIGVSWAIGLFGACMEPVLWHIEFNETNYPHELSVWQVARVFTICEQAYIYGCVVLCLIIYLFVAAKLRAQGNKVATAGKGKSDAKREHKILIQSFLITIVLSSVRGLVVGMQFAPPDVLDALICVWTVFIWAHHALTPVICTVMSAEIRALMFFWMSNSKKLNQKTTQITAA